MQAVVTRRRVVAAVLVAVSIAAAWTAWLGWRTALELRTAQSSVEQLRAAIGSGDVRARAVAADRLRTAADAAADHTGGWWWGSLTHLPVLGDDAAGVEALSRSLDIVASDVVAPGLATLDGLDTLSGGGRVDVDAVAGLAGPVGSAHDGIERAVELVDTRSSAGFAEPLRTRYDEYVDTAHELEASLTSAQDTVRLLPDMLGRSGARDYLLIFQNNAEVRATGGLPGSWALLHADDGTLSIEEQGAATDFPVLDEPVSPLSPQEQAVYGTELGRYFQDVTFTPDFPRAAELAARFWALEHPRTPLDGVVALDPVALGYLLDATGPVSLGGAVELTSDNAVPLLLNQVYRSFADPAQQDAAFQETARRVFDAVTRDALDPQALLGAITRAAGERRLLVAAFDPDEAEALAGTALEGALAGDDGSTPHVDVGLNDATGSKMSYYLRYSADVDATGCVDGVQQLSGTVQLRQTVGADVAAALPAAITGGGRFGTEAGQQFVAVRVYGPYGGSVRDVAIDGDRVGTDVTVVDGRPVATMPVLLDSTESLTITWSMTSGAGQVGDAEVGVTPGVDPGSLDSVVPSAC